MSYADTIHPNAPVSMVEKWDKTFAESAKVDHRKVSFQNRYGITWSAISTFQKIAASVSWRRSQSAVPSAR